MIKPTSNSTPDISGNSSLRASLLMKILLFQAVLILFFFAWNNQLQNQLLHTIENSQPMLNVPGSYKAGAPESSGTSAEATKGRVLQQGAGSLLPSEVAENINLRSIEIANLESQIADLKSQLESSSRRLTSDDPDARLYEFANSMRGNATLQINIPGSGGGKEVHLDTKSSSGNPTHLILGSKGQRVGVGVDVPESMLHVKGRTLAQVVHAPEIKISENVTSSELSSSGLTVTKEGLVGILNQNPKSTVDIVGNAKIERNVDANSVNVNGRLLVEQSLVVTGHVLGKSAQLSSLEIQESLDSSNKLVITSDGNLGISKTGTIPKQSLEVEGVVISDSLSVAAKSKSTIGQLKVDANGVGLGVEPGADARLKVKGSTLLTGDLYNDMDDESQIGSLKVNAAGNAAIGGSPTADRLNIAGNVKMTNGDIFVRTNTMSNVGKVKISPNGNVGIGVDPDSVKRLVSNGPADFDGDLLVSVSFKSNLGVLNVNNKDQVAIGDTFERSFTVNGETAITKDLLVEPKIKSQVLKSDGSAIMNILADGRVGVGKMPEDHQFEVEGDVQVTKLLNVAVSQVSKLGPLSINKIGRVGFNKTPLKHELEIGGDMAVSKEMTVTNLRLSNLGQIFFTRNEEAGQIKERVGFGAIAEKEIAEVVGTMKITKNIFVDGSDKSYINSLTFHMANKNVGVGLYPTVTPLAANALHVNGTIYGTDALKVDTKVASQIYPMTIVTATQRVGINQKTPAKALDVVGGAKVTGDLLITGTDVSIVGPVKFYKDAKIEMKNQAAASSNQKGVYIGGDVLITKDLTTPATSDVTFGSNFYIKNSKFGIYNANPTYELDVSGNARVSQEITCPGTAAGNSQFGAEVNINPSGVGINTAVDPNYALKVEGNFVSLDVKFAPNAKSSIGQITQTVDNKFGIHNAAPTRTLDVKGSVQITKDLNAKSATIGLLQVDAKAAGDIVYVSDKLSIGQEIPATELHVKGSTSTQGLITNDMPLAVDGGARLGAWKVEAGPLSCFFDENGKFLINAMKNKGQDLTVNGDVLTQNIVAESGDLGIFKLYKPNAGATGLLMDAGKAALSDSLDATADFYVPGTIKATTKTYVADEANIAGSFIYTKGTGTLSYAKITSSGSLFISALVNRVPKQSVHVYGNPANSDTAFSATSLSLKKAHDSTATVTATARIGMIKAFPIIDPLNPTTEKMVFTLRSNIDSTAGGTVFKIDQSTQVDSTFQAKTLKSKFLDVRATQVLIHRDPDNAATDYRTPDSLFVNGEILINGNLLNGDQTFHPKTAFLGVYVGTPSPFASAQNQAISVATSGAPHIFHSKGFSLGTKVFVAGLAPELSVSGKILVTGDVRWNSDFSLLNRGFPSPLSLNEANSYYESAGGPTKLFIGSSFNPLSLSYANDPNYVFKSGGSVKATGSVCVTSTGKCLHCGFQLNGDFFESQTTNKISLHKTNPLLVVKTAPGAETSGVIVKGKVFSETDVCLSGGAKTCLADLKVRGLRKSVTKTIEGNAYIHSATEVGKLIIDSDGSMCLGCYEKTPLTKTVDGITKKIALKIPKGARIELPDGSDIEYEYHGASKSFKGLLSSLFTVDGNLLILKNSNSKTIFQIDQTFGYIISGESTSPIQAAGLNSELKTKGYAIGLRVTNACIGDPCKGKFYFVNVNGELFMCGKQEILLPVNIIP